MEGEVNAAVNEENEVCKRMYSTRRMQRKTTDWPYRIGVAAFRLRETEVCNDTFERRGPRLCF